MYSYMLHDSETWPVKKKENKLTLDRAEMRKIRWMCGIHVTDKVTCSELRDRVEIVDIITCSDPRLNGMGVF